MNSKKFKKVQTIFSSSTLFGAKGLAMALLLFSGQTAKADLLRVNYDVALIGLPVGSASLTMQRLPDAKADFSYQSEIKADLMFLDKPLTAVAKGKMAKAEPDPEMFKYHATTGDGPISGDLSFRDKKVVALDVRHHDKDRSRDNEDWVPVEEEHMQDVLDPISTLMLSSQHINSDCTLSRAVFTGRSRIDISLQKPKKPQTPPKLPDGLSAPVHACQLKLKPVAGYERDGDDDDILVHVWFAQVDDHLTLPYALKANGGFGKRFSITAASIMR